MIWTNVARTNVTGIYLKSFIKIGSVTAEILLTLSLCGWGGVVVGCTNKSPHLIFWWFWSKLTYSDAVWNFNQKGKLEIWVWSNGFENFIKIRWKSVKWDLKEKFKKLNMHHKSTSPLWLFNLIKLSYTTTNHIRPFHPINHNLHIIRVCLWNKDMTFQVYIRSRCKWSCGEGGGVAFTCEHILDYTNNPKNFLTLISTLSSDLY